MFSRLLLNIPLMFISLTVPFSEIITDTKPIARPQTTSEYFSNLSLDLHSQGSESGVENNETVNDRDINTCKKILANGLQLLPSFHMQALNDLTLNFEHTGKRGLAGAGDLLIRCDIETDPELLAVFIHEMGHVVDGNALIGTSNKKSKFKDLGVNVSIDDPSLTFYSYSWENDGMYRTGMNESAFCSTYGMTDPYEDFAECYVYYVLHGQEFRSRTSTNETLANKYQFMKDFVFFGREYSYDRKSDFDDAFITRDVVVYDITKLPYDYKSI